jgi:hypothetical protein
LTGLGLALGSVTVDATTGAGSVLPGVSTNATTAPGSFLAGAPVQLKKEEARISARPAGIAAKEILPNPMVNSPRQ